MSQPLTYIKTEKLVVINGKIQLAFPPNDILGYGFVFGGVKNGTVLFFPVQPDPEDTEEFRTLLVLSQPDNPAEGVEVMIQYTILVQQTDEPVPVSDLINTASAIMDLPVGLAPVLKFDPVEDRSKPEDPNNIFFQLGQLNLLSITEYPDLLADGRVSASDIIHPNIIINSILVEIDGDNSVVELNANIAPPIGEEGDMKPEFGFLINVPEIDDTLTGNVNLITGDFDLEASVEKSNKILGFSVTLSRLGRTETRVNTTSDKVTMNRGENPSLLTLDDSATQPVVE